MRTICIAMSDPGGSLEVTVRPAEEADYAQIGELLVRVYIGEGFSPSRAAASLSDVGQRAAGADTMVAVGASGILGAVFLALNGPTKQIAGPGEAELRTLAVWPAVRRRGVAESLVRACIARAQAAGMSGIVLSTQPSMAAAQQLYAKLGFGRVADRDWARRDGRPMLAYALRFNSSGSERDVRAATHGVGA